MSNSTWQRKAPVLALLLAAGAAGVVIWLQPADPSTDQVANISTQPFPAQPTPLLPEKAASQAAAAVEPHDGDVHEKEHGSVVSDQDIQAQLLRDLGELENKFLSEPVSAGWSVSTQKMISDSLSESRLAANEAPIPVSHDAECRSTSCRIRVTYRNQMDAQMGEIFLLGGIANELPSANFGRLVAPDGSVQIVMYADTGVVKSL